MSNYLNKWKEFKETKIVKEEDKSLLLREFNDKDRKRVLSSGDNFTISYEIEMETDDEIDPHTGDYTGGASSSDPDADNMSSEEQVDYFGAESMLRDSAREQEADTYIFDGLYRDKTDYNLGDVLMATIAISVVESGIDTEPVEITDSIVESFILASYLSSERGFDYNDKLTNFSTNKATYEKILQIAESLGAKIDTSYSPDIKKQGQLFDKEETADLPENTPEYRENKVGSLFGFGGDEWKLTYNIRDDEYSPKELFNKIFNIENSTYFEEELEILKKSTEFLVKSRYITLGTLADIYFSRTTRDYNRETSEWEENFSPYFKVSQFDEYRDSLNILKTKAKEAIQGLFDDSVQSFDYSDYGFTNPYDANSGGSYNIGGNALEDHLTHWWKKYKRDMTSVSDGSLEAGKNIEIKMDTYLLGLDTALKYLDDFFDDFEGQDFFHFTKETGLHTNISMDIPDKNFNILKSLFFLGEEARPNTSVTDDPEQAKIERAKTVPFVFRGASAKDTAKEDKEALGALQSRQASHWSQRVKEKIYEKVAQYLKEDEGLKNHIIASYKDNNISEIERVLNHKAIQAARTLTTKHHGFNVNYIDSRGYIEFRYPGHEISRDILKNLTIYYCHIVKTALDPEYKKEAYQAKLIGFIQDMLAEKGENEIQFTKKLSKLYIPYSKKGEDVKKLFIEQYSVPYIKNRYGKSNDLTPEERESLVNISQLIPASPNFVMAIKNCVSLLPQKYNRFISMYFSGDKIFTDIGILYYFMQDVVRVAFYDEYSPTYSFISDVRNIMTNATTEYYNAIINRKKGIEPEAQETSDDGAAGMSWVAEPEVKLPRGDPNVLKAAYAVQQRIQNATPKSEDKDWNPKLESIFRQQLEQITGKPDKKLRKRKNINVI